MKKNLFLIILSVCTALCLGGNAFAVIDLDDDSSGGSGMKQNFFILKGGYDMGGSMDYDMELEVDGFGSDSDSDSVDIESGFSVGAELGSAMNENVLLGVGVNYQFERGIDEETGSQEPAFNFVPLYGLLKLVSPSDSMIPFGILHVGYNLLFANDDLKGDGDVSGGIYWGIGGGLIFDNGVQIELLYAQHRGSYEISGYEPTFGADYTYTEDYVYKKITISIGINL